MESVTLNLAAQSTYFKLKKSGSKDSGIFLDTTTYDFIKPFLGVNEDGKPSLAFTIYQEDCIKSLGNIMCSLPLHISAQGISKEIVDPVAVYKDLSNQINRFFAGAESKVYSGLYLTNLQDRIYLWGTEGKKRLFELRKFFVANHTSITFVIDDAGLLSLRFSTNIVEEHKVVHEALETIEVPTNDSELKPLQVIYFGAPGTGKSHRIKQECKEHEHYRITFHPDTDYASFVGSYKPITHSEKVYTNMGDKAIALKDEYGNPITTTKITYKYVYQAFLNAYIAAWKEQQNEEPKPVFLVIEEINRGNCAQIFGDIFQLLDRNDVGFSDYPIVTDNDLKKELETEFAKLSIANADAINGLYEESNVVDKVIDGSRLLLPNNLYIWATMNTSDQSLFPIDSAFKRRWEWKYIKIADSGKNYIISVNGNEYDWWTFVSKINDIIGSEIEQEDKKLGYFFAKTSKNADGRYIISADTFLSKVIFFLYNDVFKDFGFEFDFFKDKDGEIMLFADYFNEYGDTDDAMVETFLQNLGLKPINITQNSEDDSDDENDSDDDSDELDSVNGRNYDRYSIVGEGKPLPKKKIARELVRKYISMHPEMSATDVINNWKPLQNIVSHFLESEAEYNQRVNIDGKQPRAYELDCSGEKIYVSSHGWGTIEKMEELREALIIANLGVNIQKPE